MVNEPEQAQPGQGGEPAAALRLRSERPPVMRLADVMTTEELLGFLRSSSAAREAAE